MDKSKFYITSDEVRNILGEVTENEKQICGEMCKDFKAKNARIEANKNISISETIDPNCELGKNLGDTMRHEFIDFINASLNGEDISFNFVTYDGWSIEDMCDYFNVPKTYENSFGFKLQNMCDNLIGPKILSISEEEISESGLVFNDGIWESGAEWRLVKKLCVSKMFFNGKEELWRNYQKTSDYERRIGLAFDVEQEFKDLFKGVYVMDDITNVDGKLTIVNNVDIYKTVLPKEVLDCLDIKETKKEREFER